MGASDDPVNRKKGRSLGHEEGISVDRDYVRMVDDEWWVREGRGKVPVC